MRDAAPQQFPLDSGYSISIVYTDPLTKTVLGLLKDNTNKQSRVSGIVCLRDSLYRYRHMRKPFLHHLQDYFFPHPRNNHRPHLFSVMSVAALVCAIVIFEAGYLVQTKIVFLNTNFLAAVLPGMLADLTNESRAENGITPVTRDTLLDTAAQAAAEDMAAKGYFAHVSPDGKSPWYWLDHVGYSYSYAGENLAVNFTDSENVQTAWMASPTHRANIMKPQYTHVGFGTAHGVYEGKETTFVVEFFATPVARAVEKVAPTSVTAKPSPIKKITTSTNSSEVLGSETSAPAAPTTKPNPTAQTGWFVSLLASPLNTLIAILTVLFAIIAFFFTIAILIRGSVQHRSVVIGGALLLLLISAALLFSTVFTGPVLLSVESQSTASAGMLP